MGLQIADCRLPIVSVSLALLVVLAGCGAAVSESELAGRIAKCEPQWQGYQEDVKGQIGAGPVAEWKGEPVKAVQEGAVVRLTFRLAGPWALRDGGIPVMMQDPMGHVRQSSGVTRENGLVTYDFKVEAAETASFFPWVEVKFPNGDKRIVFDEKGVWNGDQAGLN